MVIHDTIQIDTLSIIPNTLIIKDSAGKIIDSSNYFVDYAKAILILKKSYKLQVASLKTKGSQILQLSYAVFPYNLSKEFKHKDSNFLQKQNTPGSNLFYSYEDKKKSSIFEFGSLEKSGSISRGISFGNTQDVVVNSNLNLQLSGKLSEDIEIMAAITDKNIPIQPEGNTQQIQDFDKVFIQLSNKKSKLIAGDFEMTRPKSYFLNFYKKVEGGSFTTLMEPSSKSKMTTYASLAISKGMYAQNIITAIEGIQGPYRLTGAQNELYIVVLSGTEKVYLDGRLLIRGQDNDYVIDYNTAEITFTPKNLITKDKRISVEFQYSNQNYARSLFFTGSEFEQNKLKVRFNFYSEQDMKNQPLLQTLTQDQKVMLGNIGNNINNAYTSGVDSVGFQGNQVLYKRIISGKDTIYVYSINSDSAFYQLSFTDVGEGKGHYVQINSAANGRVFQWIAPQNGVLQGDYEPIILLITPKKNQMFTIAADYQLTKKTKLNIEYAISNHDVNTFSKLDKGDDVGYALKMAIENKTSLGTNKKWVLTSGFNYEWVNENFNPIEQYRNIEFQRDWNLGGITTLHDQDLVGLDMGLTNPQYGFINYQFKTFLEGPVYNGLKNLLNFDLHKKSFFLKSNCSLLESDGVNGQTQFFRQQSVLTKKFQWFNLGISDDQEHNTFRDVTTKILQANSFAYNEWQCFASSGDTTANHFKLYYKQRIDNLPKNNSFKEATLGQTIGAEMNLIKKRITESLLMLPIAGCL